MVTVYYQSFLYCRVERLFLKMLGYLISKLTAILLWPFAKLTVEKLTYEEMSSSDSDEWTCDCPSPNIPVIKKTHNLSQALKDIDKKPIKKDKSQTKKEEAQRTKFDVLDEAGRLLTIKTDKEFDDFLDFVGQYPLTYTYTLRRGEELSDSNPQIKLLLSRMERRQDYKIYTAKYDNDNLRCFAVMDPKQKCQHIVYLDK